MQPFRLDVSAADMEALRDRLARTRWPEQLPGDTGWAEDVPCGAPCALAARTGRRAVMLAERARRAGP
ncbi:hypothetical protein ACWKWC_07530 [Geodermatophilus nigrescens]